MNWTAEYPTDSVSLYVFQNGTVTVSEDDTWLPGVYESRAAALAAVKTDPDRVAQLAETAKQRGTPITELELA